MIRSWTSLCSPFFSPTKQFPETPSDNFLKHHAKLNIHDGARISVLSGESITKDADKSPRGLDGADNRDYSISRSALSTSMIIIQPVQHGSMVFIDSPAQELFAQILKPK